MIVLCANLPNGPEIIEIICTCRPQWARIALDRKCRLFEILKIKLKSCLKRTQILNLKNKTLKIFNKSLLRTTDLDQTLSTSIIHGLITLFPQLSHSVLSSCFDSNIHANLLFQIMCQQPPKSFLSLFDSLHRRNRLKWLSSKYFYKDLNMA